MTVNQNTTKNSNPYSDNVAGSEFAQDRIYHQPDGTVIYRGESFWSAEEAKKARSAHGLGEEYTQVDSPSDMLKASREMYEEYGLANEFMSRMNDYSGAKTSNTMSAEIAANRQTYIDDFGIDVEPLINKAMQSGAVGHGEFYAHLIMTRDKANPLSLISRFANKHPWETTWDFLPIFGSVEGVSQLYQLADAIERLDTADDEYYNSDMGRDDIKNLTLYLDYQSRDRTFGYNVANILYELPGFAAELAATRGVYTWIKEGTTEVIRKKIMSLLGDRIKNKVLRKSVDLGIRGTGAVAGAGGQAQVIGGPRMMEKYHELTMPEFEDITKDEEGNIKDFLFKEGDGAWEAAVKSWGDITIEYISEHSGPAFSAMGSGIKSAVVKTGLLKAMKNNNPNKTYNEIMGMLEKVGYHGVFNEMMEERLGEVLRTPMNGYQLPTLEQLAIEMTAFSVPGVAASVTGIAADIGDKTREQKEEQLADFVKGFVQRATTMPRPVETAMALTEQQGLDPIERRGPTITKEYKNKVLERTEDVGVSELQNFFYDEKKQDMVNLSLGWYRDGFDNAMDEVQSEEIPELSDINHRNYFRAVVAAYSIGKGPKNNADHSIDYKRAMIDNNMESPIRHGRYMEKGGKEKEGYFFISPFTGEIKGIAVAEMNNINKYTKLVEHFEGDTEAADNWLSSTHTGLEIWDMMRTIGAVDANKKPQVGAVVQKETDVFGAEVFGPKVGAFWLNLKGVSDIATIDRWMTRQIRRWLGMPLASTGSQRYTWAQAEKEFQKIKNLPPKEREAAITGGKEKVDGNLPRSIGRSFLKPPTTREEFLLYRNVIQNITDKFNSQNGESLDVDQVQALLWYMEKDLYLRAGTKSSDLDLTDYQRAVNARYQQRQPTSTIAEGVGEFKEPAIGRIQKLKEFKENSEPGVREPGEPGEQEDSAARRRGTTDTESSSKEIEESSERKRRIYSRISQGVQPLKLLSGENTGTTFANSIANFKTNNRNGAAVTNFGAEVYENEQVDDSGNITRYHNYLSEDGTTGFSIAEIVPKLGDNYVEIRSLFNNNPDIKLSAFIGQAISQARTFNLPVRLEVFDTTVKERYEEVGFYEQSRVPWNEKYRPSDWSDEYKLYLEQHHNIPKGEPDFVTMEFRPPQEKPYEILDTREGRLGYITRKIVDRFKPFLNLTEQADEQRRVNQQLSLYDNEDVYTTAMLTNNRIANRQNKVFNNANVLLTTVVDAGFTIDELGDYLHAQHAAERNRIIRNRGGMQDGGSGMKSQDANKILEKYRTTRLPVFANEFRQFVALEKKIRLDAGLIDQATYDAWDTMFDSPDGKTKGHYVPLRAAYDDPNGMFGNRSGRGFEVRGPESQRIKPVTEMVKRRNPVIQTLVNLDDAIIRSENNQVGLSLLNLVREFGLTGVEVRKLQYKPEFDDDGEIRYLKPLTLNENDYVVKENGQIFVLDIQEESLLRALRGVTHDAVPVLREINGFLRNMTTVYNPEFWIGNFFRDIQTAGINLAGEQSSEMAGQVIKWTLGGGPQMGVWHSARGKDGYNEWAEWYDDMTEQGGKVSWKKFEDFEKKEQRMLKAIADGRATGKVRRAGANIMNAINSAGDAVEQGVRLASYRAAVERGIPKRQAALLARNLTVDFNKKGELGAFFNSMYLFSNASIQGSARVIGSIFDKNSATRYYGAGLSMISYYFAMASMAANPDEWAKKNDWEKFNNYIVQTPSGPDIRLRVPYGYNIFHALGVAMAELEYEKRMTGESNPENVSRQVWNVLGSFNDAFNPIGSDSWTTLAPTAAQPMVQSFANEKWNSATIEPESFGNTRKEEFRFKSDTPGYALDLSEAMHRISGGKQTIDGGRIFRYGGVDVHPNQLQHWLEFGLGGLGKLVTRTMQTGSYIFNEKKLPPAQMIPGVRLFVKEASVDNLRSSVYNLVEWSKDYQLRPHEIIRFYNDLEAAIDGGVIKEEQGGRLFRDFQKNQRLIYGRPKEDTDVITRGQRRTQPEDDPEWKFDLELEKQRTEIKLQKMKKTDEQ